MVTVLADQHKVRFFGSPDLKNWETLSDFGPGGRDRWRVGVSRSVPAGGRRRTGERLAGCSTWTSIPARIAGGSGGQYFVGTFDGTTFVNDNAPGRRCGLDYGKDFYATLSFSDIPPADGRRIWMAWISNWLYANEEPTEIWRGAQSVPRQLSLRRLPDGHSPGADAGRGADRRCATQRAGRSAEQRGRCPDPPRSRSMFASGDWREAGVRLFNAAGEDGHHRRQSRSRSNCSSIASVRARPRSTRTIRAVTPGPSGGATARSRCACCSIDRCSRSSPTTARRSITDRVYPTQPLDRLELLPGGRGSSARMWEMRSVWPRR